MSRLRSMATRMSRTAARLIRTTIVGALVIANWSFGLIRDSGAILLDMNADGNLAEKIRKVVEINGDRLANLHLWRLGPGHLGAIMSMDTMSLRSDSFCRDWNQAWLCVLRLRHAPSEKPPCNLLCIGAC